MGVEHASCNVRDGARRGWRAMVQNAAAADAPASRERDRVPAWRVSYPAEWPADPDPDNKVTDWSRHWDWPGVFNPRCPRCREHGRACTDAADAGAPLSIESNHNDERNEHA